MRGHSVKPFLTAILVVGLLFLAAVIANLLLLFWASYGDMQGAIPSRLHNSSPSKSNYIYHPPRFYHVQYHPGEHAQEANEIQAIADILQVRFGLTPQRAGRLAISFVRWGYQYGVAPTVLVAMAKVESDFRPRVRSSRGAVGIMQISPDVWLSDKHRPIFLHTIKDLENPDTNIRMGAFILSYYRGWYGGLRPALAAYNGGTFCASYIDKCSDVSAYVDKVIRLTIELGNEEYASKD